MSSHRILYITVPSQKVGRTLSRRMVEERLAACAHLLPAGESFYRWEGELMEEAEFVIIAKTRADLVETAIARIAAWHDYQVSCILALPIEEGHQPFLRWVDGGVAAGGG